jgi:hypothetical protein
MKYRVIDLISADNIKETVHVNAVAISNAENTEMVHDSNILNAKRNCTALVGDSGALWQLLWCRMPCTSMLANKPGRRNLKNNIQRAALHGTLHTVHKFLSPTITTDKLCKCSGKSYDYKSDQPA